MALTSPRFASNVRLQRAADNEPVMNWGEVGDAVRVVQQALHDLNPPPARGPALPFNPNGVFDDATKNLVIAFQRKHGLKAFGIVGTTTLEKLDALLRTPAKPLPPHSGAGWITHKFRIVMRTIAVPKIPEEHALEDSRVVYGTYGFRVDEGAGMSLRLSKEERVKLKVIDTECNWDQEDAEQTKLFELGGGRSGVGTTEIMVYYVNKIRDTEDDEEMTGCAGHKPGKPACVVSSTAAKYVMAHEVGHVLLGSDFRPRHHTSSANLMYKDTLTADPPGLTEDQVRKIRASPFCFKI